MRDEPENEELDEGLGENPEQEQTSLDSNSTSSKASEIANKEIQKKLSKSVTKNAVKQSLVKALLPVLTWVLVFIIILIIIIGIVMFFITMPGMVMDKLKDLSISIGNKLEAFFGGDTTAQIQDQQVYDVLDYLEQMGYDLKGYGFLTDYVGESKDGVERNDEGKIKEAKSDFIYTYLVSDNYVYTIANFNQTNDLANNGHRILGAIVSVFQKVGNLFTNGQLGQFWGRGMISVYHESSIGVPGTYYGGFGDLIGWSGIKINIDEEKDEKTLQVRRGWGSGVKSFNLDGWTGRYGMPIDFLLSVHLATMMPDLAYDMVESFDTQIVMLLHKTGSYLEGTASYDPYIAYVKNHWYRDVYFVQTDREFVDYDYEYESVMKERWTLYETYPADDPERAGEYKLYEINDDGTYKTSGGEYILFDGTADEAEKNGVKVAKKAQTIKYSNNSQFEEIEWNKNSWGIWTAYKINSSGSLTQTGEGLRTETNPEIKKMFLNNRYFRYDGSVETAEVIDKLRENINPKTNYYGPVKGIGPDGNEVDYTSVTAVVDGETKKVEDFSGEVSLNQDSLNAFSMLENEHTLDADYIYRDFKELIVELGYFEKEELTDETPRLLEFLVPDIGSFQYPKRSIDKNENEFGTMIHSKGDIDAQKYNAISQIAQENEELGDYIEDGDTQTEPEKDPTIQDEKEQNIALNDLNQLVGASGSYSSKYSGGSKTYTIDESVHGDGYDYGVELHGVTYKKYRQNKGCGSYATKPFGSNNYVTSGCGPISSAILASGYGVEEGPLYYGNLYHGTPPSLSGIKEALATVGIEGEAYTIGNSASPDLTDKGLALARRMEEALEEGKPVIVLVGKAQKLSDAYQYTSGGHYFVFIGIDDDGTPIYCNTTSDTHEYTHRGDFQRENPIEEFVYYYMQNSQVSSRGIFIPDEAPKNIDKPELYEGYLGNEAVVSPVTGILLEYGTYDGIEKDSITNEPYRTNIDLKYETTSGLIDNPDDNPENPQTDPEVPKEIEPEKVGYAKILVLDDETYKKLETSLIGSTRWRGNTFLPENGNYDEKDIQDLNKEKIKNWTDIERTLYGYKEFAESYQEFGISGNIVYIEGFKCELPDEKFNNESEDDLENKIPDGEDLSFQSFQTITTNSFTNGKISSSVKIPESEYEKDDDYKLASKKATDKLNMENKIKNQAAPSLVINDGITIIKEGTVLGRTITDKELLESPEYRAGKNGTYESIRKNKDIKPQVIGNYLRIIMRDKDKTVVENVEDYMKLDDGILDKKKNDWELFYFIPFESGAADVKPSYLRGRYTGTACVSSCSEGEVAIGIIQETSLTSDGLCNQRDNFIPFMKENYPEFYNILSFMDGKGPSWYWSDYNGANSVQSALLKCDEFDHEEFLTAQMEEAKEHYYYGMIEEVPWLEERPPCVQAEILHLKLWGAKWRWVKSYQNKSDEQILDNVRYTIANTSSTAGPASGNTSSGRAFNEPEIAYGILDGKLTEDEVEEWVRTADRSILTDNGIEQR